jgi:hypothetical protein
VPPFPPEALRIAFVFDIMDDVTNSDPFARVGQQK